jgi:hypothetical protein
MAHEIGHGAARHVTKQATKDDIKNFKAARVRRCESIVARTVPVELGPVKRVKKEELVFLNCAR